MQDVGPACGCVVGVCFMTRLIACHQLCCRAKMGRTGLRVWYTFIGDDRLMLLRVLYSSVCCGKWCTRAIRRGDKALQVGSLFRGYEGRFCSHSACAATSCLCAGWQMLEARYQQHISSVVVICWHAAAAQMQLHPVLRPRCAPSLSVGSHTLRAA